MQKSMERPLKIGINLPHDPELPLLGIYPEKTTILKDTCTPVFIAALFTITRTQKQPRCPSTDKWIKKMWYVYIMEYYSVTKKKFESVLVRWMNLESITQSKAGQRKTNIMCQHIYMETRKMVMMNLLAGKEQRHICREQTVGNRGKRESGTNGEEALTYIYTVMC